MEQRSVEFTEDVFWTELQRVGMKYEAWGGHSDSTQLPWVGWSIVLSGGSFFGYLAESSAFKPFSLHDSMEKTEGEREGDRGETLREPPQVSEPK